MNVDLVDCGVRADQLLAYLQAPAQHPTIENHLPGCPTCRQRLAHLAQAVLAPQVAPITCQECETWLPEYVQTQLESGDPKRSFPQVAAHLAHCLDCQRTYREMAAMSELALRGALPQPVGYRRPDLSFLRPAPSPKDFSDIVRRGSHWLQDRLQGLVIDLGAMGRTAGWQLATAGVAGTRSLDQREVMYQLDLGPETLDDLDVEVTVYRQQEDVARVVVVVRLPDRLVEGFAGSQVQMRAGATVHTKLTDEDGLAVFDDVPLAELQEARFAIAPPSSIH